MHENEFAPYENETQAYEAYDEMLDDAHEDVVVAGFTFSTSRALRELDPIAYRCGFIDWLDSEQQQHEED